jgi:hypothetical protein
MRVTASQGVGLDLGALSVNRNLSARRGYSAVGGRDKINQLDGEPSRSFSSFLGLPPLEVGAEDEKFATDLDNANLFFLNDSAEMAYREAGQAGCVGNVEKHSLGGPR